MKNAIELEGIGKQYRIGLKEQLPETMLAGLVSLFAAPVKNYRRLRRLSEVSTSEDPDVLWAVRDVSFEVPEGQVLGVIGGNGAGKSTLLKILARITEPTTGRSRIKGRVGSLLEVGTGFHPELTGRENIYLNGTILGMRKRDVDRRFDEIVDFSGLETFVDTPVKRYSSGMRVRLAFSVAAHLEPEILLVDEVLAVGDVDFQRKCLGKLESVASQGRTVLFVSHQLSMITKLCDSCLLMDRGRVVFQGSAAETVSKYALTTQQKEADSGEEGRASLSVSQVNGQASVGTIEQSNAEPTEFEVTLVADRDYPSVRVILLLHNAQGTLLIHHSYTFEAVRRGANRFRVTMPALQLLPGVYGVHFKSLATTLQSEGVWRLFSEVSLITFTGEMQPSGRVQPVLSPSIDWRKGEA